MSEKRVYAASRSFTPFFGAYNGPKSLPAFPNTIIPQRNPLCGQTQRASGAFTLSINPCCLK